MQTSNEGKELEQLIWSLIFASEFTKVLVDAEFIPLSQSFSYLKM